MQKLMSIIALFLLIFACEKLQLDALQEVETMTLRSVSNGHTYRLQVHLPVNYQESQSYPVLFLLDGNWYTQKFSRELDELIQDGQVPPTILIGIGYENNPDEQRFRDYTFPTDPEYDISTGQAAIFQKVLQSELIPFVEDQYAVDPERYFLAGHSLGGLNALYHFFNNDVLNFAGYIAVSPSIWWQEGYLFSFTETFQPSRAGLYLAVGGDEPPSMTALQAELGARLARFPGLRLKAEAFPGASHSQTPMRGFREGISFLINQ